MGITNSNKLISTDVVDCGGTFTVNLTLAAAPDIVENPTDIVLILDRSGSMEGIPLANLKLGADTFIDIIDEATDGSGDGQIGTGSRMAVVSFADTATQDTQMITSVAGLKAAVAALDAGGFTNHGDAFAKAFALFDPMSTNAKVMVMFTDGKTTAGPPPGPIAAAARAAGAVIYVIGLVGDDGIDEAALNDWATDPDASHVAIAPTAADLEQIFADLARNISKPGATNIVIDEILSSEFSLVQVDPPDRGNVSILNSTALRWNIDELGVSGNEGASLQFSVRYIGGVSGTFPVNASIVYSDEENNVVTFQNPAVEAECDTVIYPEPCPEPVSVTIEGCSDSVEYSVGDGLLTSLGRILQVDLTLRNICPGRRVALAVILNELDEYGEEHQRGMKIMTIPAHARAGCSDVQVKCIKFVLPEDLNVSGGCRCGICDERNFTVSTICNYVDSGFQCCSTV